MEDTNLAAMYQATVYPIYVVIDRDGFIAGTQRGAGGEEALRRRRESGKAESSERWPTFPEFPHPESCARSPRGIHRAAPAPWTLRFPSDSSFLLHEFPLTSDR